MKFIGSVDLHSMVGEDEEGSGDLVILILGGNVSKTIFKPYIN